MRSGSQPGSAQWQSGLEGLVQDSGAKLQTQPLMDGQWPRMLRVRRAKDPATTGKGTAVRMASEASRSFTAAAGDDNRPLALVGCMPDELGAQ